MKRQVVAQRIAYHDSKLSGEEWVQEQLRSQNAFKCRDSLGMNAQSFQLLVKNLLNRGSIKHSRGVSAEMQVAIFLYIVRRNASVRETADRFNCSWDTVSK